MNDVPLTMSSKHIRTVEVTTGKRVCCPLSEHASWNQHPRVYIDLQDHGEAVCPYCSTRFIMKTAKPDT